jgi:hypothetical protein
VVARAKDAEKGKAARKTEEFLRAHPICCFCGVEPATTVDHVPPKVCFKKKHWPEGFEFPACAGCNHGSSNSDQIIAFYIHAGTDAIDEFRRALRGVRNNNPECLPNLHMTIGQKAKFLSNRNITVPIRALPDFPVATIPAAAHPHFNALADKMGRAFYYQQMERVMPKNYRLVVRWSNKDQLGIQQYIDTVTSIMPLVKEGERNKRSLSDQFLYRFNCSPEHDVMVFMAGFSNQVFFTGVGADEKFGIKFDDFLKLPGWAEVRRP